LTSYDYDYDNRKQITIDTFMLHETIVPQQVDAVGRAHIEIYVLQIEQSGKPHTSFNVPSLDTPSQIYIYIYIYIYI